MSIFDYLSIYVNFIHCQGIFFLFLYIQKYTKQVQLKSITNSLPCLDKYNKYINPRFWELICVCVGFFWMLWLEDNRLTSNSWESIENKTATNIFILHYKFMSALSFIFVHLSPSQRFDKDNSTCSFYSVFLSFGRFITIVQYILQCLHSDL